MPISSPSSKNRGDKPAMAPQIDIVRSYSSEWPRHSEGSVAVFPDGRWLLAWTAFYGGVHDASPAHIMGKWSTDKGETWGEEFILLENDGGRNVISVSVAVLRDGSVGFAHSRTDHENCYEAWPFYRRSTDGGHTWSPHRVMVNMDSWHGFPCNSRLLELSTGRLLLPLQLNTRDSSGGGESFVQPAYSDDMGESWELSSNLVSVRGTAERGGVRRKGAVEPAAFERRDGTIMFLIRTTLGTIYAAESSDGGETLSQSYDTGLESPASPCDVARIPSTGDILLVWNKARPESPGAGRPRTPLTTAISRDEGKTWGNFKDLEPDPSRTYMYPALSFDGDTALVLYSEGGHDCGPVTWQNTSLKLARVPYQWFYE